MADAGGIGGKIIPLRVCAVFAARSVALAKGRKLNRSAIGSILSRSRDKAAEGGVRLNVVGTERSSRSSTIRVVVRRRSSGGHWLLPVPTTEATSCRRLRSNLFDRMRGTLWCVCDHVMLHCYGSMSSDIDKNKIKRGLSRGSCQIAGKFGTSHNRCGARLALATGQFMRPSMGMMADQCVSLSLPATQGPATFTCFFAMFTCRTGTASLRTTASVLMAAR